MRHVAAQVDGERRHRADRLYKVAQVLRAFELLLLKPLVDEIFALLRDRRPTQLERFVLVELAGLEQQVEIFKHRIRLPLNGGRLLELLQGVWRSQNVVRRVDCDACRFLVLAVAE